MEIIERKGLGHPDTIADMLSEGVAKELQKAYKKQYGKIMHYNVDKTMVCAGEFINGVQTIPVHVVFAGQATGLKTKEDLNKILHKVTKKVLKFYISKGMKYKLYNMINLGSPDLVDNFQKKKCNDTSFAVGTFPSPGEKLVMKLGKYIDNLHKKNKNIGIDNKIMLFGDIIYLALAFMHGNYNYFKEKQKLKIKLEKISKKKVFINCADNEKTQFKTYTGTSLEMGDSGATGRGNRRNGLITPLRPMTLEAYYGKNNQTHIGRIYQDLALKIAKKKKKDVVILNSIGGDIKKPKIHIINR